MNLEIIKQLLQFLAGPIGWGRRIGRVEEDQKRSDVSHERSHTEAKESRAAIHARIDELDKDVGERIDGWAQTVTGQLDGWAQAITARIDNAVLKRGGPEGGTGDEGAD